MRPDFDLFKKVRYLSLALIISGALNIGILSLFLYWILKETPPTPYCELKPATFEQQQLPLADQRGGQEVLKELLKLSFSQLACRLIHTQLIENGYAERDLALACLVTFHHLDLERALPKNAGPKQKRLLQWHLKGKEDPVSLIVYPDLTQKQFDHVIQFIKTERCPLTAQGIFLSLKKQKEKEGEKEPLAQAFFLTPEFWTVELLFNRSGEKISRQEILAMLLEGNWETLNQFAKQQRQLQDLSTPCRQKFLLNYVKEGSATAAVLLMRTEWDFVVKKLDDIQVIAILSLAPINSAEALSFAQEMLKSPRSVNVWKKAAQWLYAQAEEPLPVEWNYQKVLSRFLKKEPFIQQEIPQKKEDPVREQVYVVQEGDSLWKIAKRFGVKVEEIKKQNHLQCDTLKTGAVLKISL